MKQHRLLRFVTIVLVCLVGSVPGLITLFIKEGGPFERPTESYWSAIIMGLPAVIIPVIVGYFLSRALLRWWLKETQTVVVRSLILLAITFLAGMINALIGWEIRWLLEKAIYLGEEGYLNYLEILSGIPFFSIYCFMWVAPTALAFGIFSFLYLKYSSR